MTNDNTPETLNTKLNAIEAAKFLGCSISFIRVQTRKGLIAHFKLGNRFYYREDDLLTLIKRVEPHNAEPSLE